MDTQTLHNDYELLQRLAVGDEYAFAALFAQYHDALVAFAYKRLHDEEDARDAVQDVFIRVWNNRTALRSETNLSSYLYRAVFNSVLNVFKQRAIRTEHLQSFREILPHAIEGTDHGIREQDMAAIITMEVAALPPKMREAFELRWRDGLSNREIAARMGLSEQTVETHMKRTLRVLRQRLTVAVGLFALIAGS